MRRIRECQIDQIDASSSEHKAYLQQLDYAGDMDALTALCSGVVSGYAARATAYWSDVARELTAIQTEMTNAVQEYEVGLVQDLRQQADQLQSSLSEGNGLFKPLLDPQSIFAFTTSNHADHDGMGSHDHGAAGYARATETKRAEARRK